MAQKVTTPQEAEEAIQQVCAWLEKGAPGLEPYEVVDGEMYQSDGWLALDTARGDLSRQMARKLLKAADAYGSGGCRLCRS